MATEAGGGVRLAHVDNKDSATLKSFGDRQIAADAHATTDGHTGYNETNRGEWSHKAVMQAKAQRRQNDAIQSCHWTDYFLKRWLIGTQAGAVRDKQLQAYVDEFAFRHNRRKTKCTVLIAARLTEPYVARPPLTQRELIANTACCRWFASDQIAVA